jgi:hypothetical protein
VPVLALTRASPTEAPLASTIRPRTVASACLALGASSAVAGAIAAIDINSEAAAMSEIDVSERRR